MSRGGNDVIVLGAGVVGVSSAYFLARLGYKVLVLDRNDAAALGTSFANGGLLTPSMADPWAAPGLPLKLLRWIGREDAPFLLRLRALPGVAGWGLRFVRECSPQRWQQNAEVIYRLSLYSQQTTSALTADTGIAYDRSDKGTLRVFQDALSIENARRSAELVTKFGCRYELLDSMACVAIEPALAAEAKQISGGIYFPDDASGDAHLFTRALAARCEQLGVEFRYGANITKIDPAGDRISGVTLENERIDANDFVVALGTESPSLLRSLGLKIPVYPVKGYSVTASTQGWNGAPSVPIVDDGRKMAITRLGNRIRLAGTAEINGFNTQLNRRRGQLLVDGLCKLFPGFNAHHTLEYWAGLRPMTPDGIPIIGKTRYQNLFLNTGHGHLGFTMACGSGKIVADLISGNSLEVGLDPNQFGIERI